MNIIKSILYLWKNYLYFEVITPKETKYCSYLKAIWYGLTNFRCTVYGHKKCGNTDLILFRNPYID